MMTKHNIRTNAILANIGSTCNIILKDNSVILSVELVEVHKESKSSHQKTLRYRTDSETGEVLIRDVLDIERVGITGSGLRS